MTNKLIITKLQNLMSTHPKIIDDGIASAFTAAGAGEFGMAISGKAANYLCKST